MIAMGKPTPTPFIASYNHTMYMEEWTTVSLPPPKRGLVRGKFSSVLEVSAKCVWLRSAAPWRRPPTQGQRRHKRWWTSSGCVRREGTEGFVLDAHMYARVVLGARLSVAGASEAYSEHASDFVPGMK